MFMHDHRPHDSLLKIQSSEDVVHCSVRSLEKSKFGARGTGIQPMPVVAELGR